MRRIKFHRQWSQEMWLILAVVLLALLLIVPWMARRFSGERPAHGHPALRL